MPFDLGHQKDWNPFLNYNNNHFDQLENGVVLTDYDYNYAGMSVRCIKD